MIGLKNQLDKKLNGNYLFGVIVVLGCVVVSILVNWLFGKVPLTFYLGGFDVVVDTLVSTIIYIIPLCITLIMRLIEVYIIYYYVYKTGFAKKLNKNILFIICTFLLLLIEKIGYSIVYDWFGVAVFRNAFFTYIGVTNVYYQILNIIDVIKWLLFSYNMSGLLSVIIAIVRHLFGIIYSLSTIVITVIVIGLDVKPDLFARLLTKKKADDYIDYSEKLEENEMTANDIIETKIDENFAKDFEQDTLDKGETPLSNQVQNMFLMTHTKYFSAEKMILVREKIENMSEEDFMMVSALEFKDPTTLLIVSIFLGGLGIDRFMLGDKGMGIIKLLTGGCCGVMTIIDWFTISKKTKELNFQKFMQL